MHADARTRWWGTPESQVVATLVALFVAAQFTDHWVFWHFAYPAVYERGWARTLRMVGYMPMWALAALALVLHDWRPRARSTLCRAGWRGILLLVCVSVAGLAAEGMKLVFRRERPGLTGGTHVFRAWSDQPLSSAQLGLPSSEAAVAFAAGTVLARLFPEASVLWYGLAIGCALTRVAAGAHFMSDVVLAAVVGYVVTRWVSRLSWFAGRASE